MRGTKDTLPLFAELAKFLTPQMFMKASEFVGANYHGSALSGGEGGNIQLIGFIFMVNFFRFYFH
jgi:hypothetical protein